MNRWCKLAVLTDEISQDLDQVIQFARQFTLEGIELRSLFGKAFKDLSNAEIKLIADRCAAEGLEISGCATPVFKCPVASETDIQAHIELFRRSVDAAQIAKTELIRVFTFLRKGHPTTSDDLKRAAEPFHELLEIARKNQVLIGVENEASCLVGTGSEMREFLSHLPKDPYLGVVWDPCNVVYLDGDNDPVRDDYPMIADRVVHVHVKDASRSNGAAAQRCVELGKGSVDFPLQLSALKARGYDGWVTLETHWRVIPLDDESQHLPAGYAFSANADPASRICMEHLQNWVAQA